MRFTVERARQRGRQPKIKGEGLGPLEGYSDWPAPLTSYFATFISL